MKHKIVINNCYGGFGLSTEAIKLYYKYKFDKEVFCYISDYSGDNEYIKTTSGEYDFYTFEDLGDYIKEIPETEPDLHWVRNEIFRHDPILVKVVEELGEKANGYCSDLIVVEIDSNKYRVEEYDGREWIETPENQFWIKIEE